MDAEETSVETVHRSPHTFEVVDPTSDQPNRQLFANSPLSDDPVTEAYHNSPDALHGDIHPNLAIIHEQPKHRIIVYLKAKGLSNREIAGKTGYTEPWISQVCRQPWFRLRLVQELKEAGIDAIQTVIKGAGLDSVFTLVELRDDHQIPPSVRKAAASDLLDRFLGKPTQRIESEEKRLPTTPEISAIESEIKQIDTELKQPTNAQEN